MRFCLNGHNLTMDPHSCQYCQKILIYFPKSLPKDVLGWRKTISGRCSQYFRIEYVNHARNDGCLFFQRVTSTWSQEVWDTKWPWSSCRIELSINITGGRWIINLEFWYKTAKSTFFQAQKRPMSLMAPEGGALNTSIIVIVKLMAFRESCNSVHTYTAHERIR